MTENAGSITKKIILKIFRENIHIFINFINRILLLNKKNEVIHLEFLFLNEGKTNESLYAKCTSRIRKNFFLSFSIIPNLENIYQIENQLINEAKNKFLKIIHSNQKGKEPMPDELNDDSVTNESVTGENIVEAQTYKKNIVNEIIINEKITKEDNVKEDITSENKINENGVNKNDFKMIFIINDTTNKINYNCYSLIEDQSLDIIEINLAAFNAKEYYRKKGRKYLRLFQSLYLNINIASRSVNYSEELMKDIVMAEIIEKIEKEFEKLVDQQSKLNEEPIIINDEEFQNDLNEDKIKIINSNNQTMIKSNSNRIEVIEKKVNDLLCDYCNNIEVIEEKMNDLLSESCNNVKKLNVLEKNITKNKSNFNKFKVNMNKKYKDISNLVKEYKSEVELNYKNNKGEIDQLRNYYKKMKRDYDTQREKDEKSIIALKLKIEEVIYQQNLQQDIQNELLLDKLNVERSEFKQEVLQTRQSKYNFNDILDKTSFEETELRTNIEQQGNISESVEIKDKYSQENSNEQQIISNNQNEQQNILYEQQNTSNEQQNISNEQRNISNEQQNVSTELDDITNKQKDILNKRQEKMNNKLQDIPNILNDEVFISQNNNSKNYLKQKEDIHLEYPIKTHTVSVIQQNNQSSNDHNYKSKTQQDIKVNSQQGSHLDSHIGKKPIMQEYPQFYFQSNSQKLDFYQETNQEIQQLNIQSRVKSTVKSRGKSRVQRKFKRTKQKILPQNSELNDYLKNEVKTKMERRLKRCKRQKTQ